MTRTTRRRRPLAIPLTLPALTLVATAAGGAHAQEGPPASPEAAVRAALTLEDSPDVRESGFRRMGLGIARGEAAGVPRTVWVAVLDR